MLIQEFIDSQFNNKHYDFRFLSFDGFFLASVTRLGHSAKGVSNISQGGSLLLNFFQSNIDEISFQKLDSSPYVKETVLDWEDIIWKNLNPKKEPEFITFEPMIVILPEKFKQRFNRICKNIDRTFTDFLENPSRLELI